jgi:peptidoglycan/LPS O-acetylase OafA/YrhL
MSTIALLVTKTTVIATIPLMFMFIVSAHENSLFGKLTRNKLLMRYGGYCYSIYLFHVLMLETLEPIRVYLFNACNLNSLGREIQFPIYFLFASLIAMGIGFLSFNFIEKPCVKFGKKCIVQAEAWLFRRNVAVPEVAES